MRRRKTEDYDETDNQPTNPTPHLIPTRLRTTPASLSPDNVRAMLKKHDFYCRAYEWNENFSHPAGRGFANQFEIRQDGGVVFDQATNLMWQRKGSSRPMRVERIDWWINKFNQAEYAGFNDWRLPTLEEAMSLMEPTVKNGNLFIKSMFTRRQRWIWTADSVPDDLQRWVVYFSRGYCSYLYPGFKYFVRAVRSG